MKSIIELERDAYIELERDAYQSGDTETADLLAYIADLEAENAKLRAQIDDMEPDEHDWRKGHDNND